MSNPSFYKGNRFERDLIDLFCIHIASLTRLLSSFYKLCINYHALAPEKYKKSVVSEMVHRIVRACSSWKAIHESLEKANAILEINQYP